MSSLRDDVLKFSKGFDHHALLHVLEILGVHDCFIRWIKAFLCDRQQRVRIDGLLSPSISPRGGIPQGTRLAPLLFAVLVNRLAEDWSTRLKYIDDATVIELIPRNSPSYLPIVASDVNKFSSHRNMRLNAKKCKEMVIDFHATEKELTFFKAVKDMRSPVRAVSDIVLHERRHFGCGVSFL